MGNQLEFTVKRMVLTAWEIVVPSENVANN